MPGYQMPSAADRPTCTQVRAAAPADHVTVAAEGPAAATTTFVTVGTSTPPTAGAAARASAAATAAATTRERARMRGKGSQPALRRGLTRNAAWTSGLRVRPGGDRLDQLLRPRHQGPEHRTRLLSLHGLRRRRRSELLPAGAAREGQPRRRRLLVDARLAPVADAARERCLQLRPLRIGELNGVVRTIQRLQLALEDV